MKPRDKPDSKPSSSRALREKQHLAAHPRGDQPESPNDLESEHFPKDSLQCYYPVRNSSFMADEGSHHESLLFASTAGYQWQCDGFLPPNHGKDISEVLQSPQKRFKDCHKEQLLIQKVEVVIKSLEIQQQKWNGLRLVARGCSEMRYCTVIYVSAGVVEEWEAEGEP
ncbi:hypothetical protein BTVI_78083 [Pitangus sulphuratus]|nr:hypothetical protein BTVI_78083 [Pitangus sulphuratus]